MNKTEFRKIIKDSINGLDLDKQVALLNKIQREWTPSIVSDIKGKITKDYTQCSKCNRYVKTKDFKTSSEKKTNIETTYTDAGYGDDDRIGEVERLYLYTICPLCGGTHRVEQMYLRTLWEKGRRD